MSRRIAPELCLVTDRALGGAGIERVVALAVAGGVTVVQLRDDATESAELIALARRLRAGLAPAGVPLIVNNRVDVAAAVGADGVHVGQGDLTPAVVRQRLGPDPILGLSITHPDQIAAVDPRLVDYLGVGPIFATATKPDAASPLGLDGLAACRARTGLPIVAIGGVGPGNAAATIRAGADGLAVVAAICGAPDPAAAARFLAAAVTAAKRERAGT